MNILGFEITRRKAQNLHSVWNQTGMWSSLFGPVRESYTTAWQNNVTLAPTQTLLSFSAVYRCVTGIASDIAKLRIKLSEKTVDGIWEEVTENKPWLPVLRKPNGYQSRIDFFESWMLSKLLFGNTYVLKQRKDRRGIVTAMHVLHPGCIRPLIAEDGSVYYQINEDFLAQTDSLQTLVDSVDGPIAVPASEIIHDRMATLWHPLVGVSPLYACSMSGTMGNKIQNNATHFFQNRALPGGILTAPGAIGDDTAARLKAAWESNFSGTNSGRIAILGDGLKFEAMMMTAEEAQQIEQLKFTVEDVARAFGYPIWKLSGSPPPYTKPDQGQVIYYTDCLQIHIEKIEENLDIGLELPTGIGTEFDLDGLLRMDMQALYESINAASDWMKIDEQRFRANYKPLNVGGNTVYRQEQDHAIEALFKRDQGEDPFGKTQPESSSTPEPEEPEELEPEMEDEMRSLGEDELELLYAAELRRELIKA